MNKLKIKITTVTPVTIGSGNELSPYADYVIDNNRIYYIDRKKLQQKIAKDDNLLESYVTGISSKMDNNRSEFDLKRFLINTVRTNIEDVSLFHCPLISQKQGSKLAIKSMLKTPFHEPYIPGSTIKGVLKTVLMYNWLSEKSSCEWIESFLSKCKDNRRESDNEIKKMHEELEKKFEYSESHPQILQQITDSNPISRNSVMVVDCYRDMPLRLECIPTGVISEFELNLEGKSWQELAKEINRYSYNTLFRDLEIIENIDDDNLNEYYNQLNDIHDLIDNAPESTAYLRIGCGKGYYFNSISEAIYDYVKEDNQKFEIFEKFLERIYNTKRGKTFDLNIFPKTRLIIEKTQESLGWVKLEVRGEG